MTKLKIAILDPIGLLYTGTTLQKRGLGGSESAVIYLSKELVKLGLDVTVFNHCEEESRFNGVRYIDLNKILELDLPTYDIAIVSRSIIPFAPIEQRMELLQKYNFDIATTNPIMSRARHKVLWLHDTFAHGDELLEDFANNDYINEIFTLSDWHTNYILNGHQWRGRYFEVLKRKIWQTRNGINLFFDEVDISAKIPAQFCYTSAVSKGLVPLLKNCWQPIKERIPEATLKVAGGYYEGAGQNKQPDAQEMQWRDLKREFHGKNGIEFTGILSQFDVARLVAESELMVYPPVFPETFGMCILEAINYNTPVVGSRFGAMEQIATEATCYLTDYEATNPKFNPNEFADLVARAHKDSYLRQQKMAACNAYKSYSGWNTVALQWKEHFYNIFNLSLSIEEKEKVRDISYNVHKLFRTRFINDEDIHLQARSNLSEKEIVIITPVYNASDYITKTIDSVAAQFYSNYHMYIIDDISTDSTPKIIQDHLNQLPSALKPKFTLIHNSKKMGALGNQIEIIKQYVKSPDTIITLLDGDDWLTNDVNIFNYINQLYKAGAHFTYGSCHSLADNIDLIAEPYPKEIIENKQYREFLFSWGIPYTHLRTFSKELFDRTDPTKYLDDDNQYYQAGGDNALFYTLIEECNPHEIKCVQKVLVNYNDLNPLNDYKINSKEQTITSQKIRTEKKQSFKEKNPPRITQSTSFLQTPQLIKSDTKSFIIKNWILQRLKDFSIALDVKILNYNPNNIFLSQAIYNEGYSNITSILDGSHSNQKQFPFFNWKSAKEISQETFDIILVDETISALNIEALKQRLNSGGYIFFNGNQNFNLPVYSETLEVLNNKITLGYLTKDFTITPPTKRILIAIPTAKYIEVETFKSIYDLQAPSNTILNFQYFFGYNVAQVRNLIAYYGNYNNYDYIFWVDSDIILPTNAIKELYNLTTDIATGYYIQRKQGEVIPEIYKWNDNGGMENMSLEEINKEPLQEVAACGFGCVLTKVSALTKIGYPQFEYHNAIDHRQTVSEDTDFCYKAKFKNIKIYLNNTIKCGHIGTTIFEP